MSAPLALEMFLRLRQEHKTNLPPDAWPLRVYVDAERDGFVFVVQSESFEAVPEGAVIPELEVTVQR